MFRFNTSFHGLAYSDLSRKGLLYSDASGRIMVPPVLWKAVLGDYMESVFGISASYGNWHDGDSDSAAAGKQLKQKLKFQGMRAITMRANIPFAEWVATEENKEHIFDHSDPAASRSQWQAKAHKVRATLSSCQCVFLFA